jgi:hypothetical protein
MESMKKTYDYFIGGCITLFFLVTYGIMAGINFVKDRKENRKQASQPAVRVIKSTGSTAKN